VKLAAGRAGFALDGFGAAYCSLAHLERQPLDQPMIAGLDAFLAEPLAVDARTIGK